MFYLDTADQLSFIITICFSFCIFIFSLWFKNTNILPRLLGIAFFTPFVAYAVSFMVQRRAVSSSLHAIAEPALLLFIFIMLVSKLEKGNYKTYKFILLSSPFIILLICNYSVFVHNYLSQPLNSLPLFVILIILNMYLLKKEKGTKSLLFWAMLPLVASATTGIFFYEGFASFIVPALKLTSYIMFTAYFYYEYFENLMVKVEEADKRVSAVNRSLDFEVKKRILEIERVNQNLVSISKIDALSQVFNKAAILDAISKIILTRPKSEFSILMFDIDNFKTINDTLGHVEGDKSIKLLSVTAKNNLRDFDLLGRYGGDEFIIILPGTNTQQAMLIAERFRKSVESSEAPHYTISIGIATYPEDGTTVKGLVQAADEGLYTSKSKGRNAVSHKNQ